MRAAMTSLFVLGACANIGPFRANGEGGGSGDAGVAGDGRTSDGSVVIDANLEVVPVKLADVSGNPQHIAVSNGYLYWTQLADHKIGRVAKAGGSAQLIDAGGAAYPIATHGGAVFWSTGDDIREASDANFTASAPLHTSTDLLSGLALSTTDFYFFESGIGVGNDELYKRPRSGGSPQLIRSNLSGPRDLAIDGTTLYVAHGSLIQKSALATPTSTTDVDTVSTNRLASGGGRACWVHQPDVNVQTRELWCSSPTAGKNKVATAGQQFLSMAVSSTHVFFIPQANDGSTEIFAYNFATQQISFVAAPPAGTLAISLAVDTSALYWLTSDDVNGEIWKLAL